MRYSNVDIPKFFRKLKKSIKKRIRKNESLIKHETEYFSLSGNKIDSCKSNIIIVSHEASITGAPILSLNIACQFSDKYNVISLLLGEGDLINQFQLFSSEVVVAAPARNNAHYAEKVIKYINSRYKIEFVIVNSIESRVVIPLFHIYYIPTISLLHEFSSYTKPKNAFVDVFYFSTKLVFSTSLTLENALLDNSFLARCPVVILPQGKSIVSFNNISFDKVESERKSLKKIIKPDDCDNGKTLIVVGAGYVQLRKGVDLFIECANRILKESSNKDFRFIWIGEGYNPERDVAYSVYLKDQVQRSGLEKSFIFMNATHEIEYAFQLADIFLLTSRLDPLPNVAIDAMFMKLPVICFDKTTGIANFLLENNLGEYCVARYLDTFDMSQKAMRLFSDSETYNNIRNETYSYAKKYFSMQKYTDNLNELANESIHQIINEKNDVETIIKSKKFIKDYYLHPKAQSKSENEAVRSYVRSFKTFIVPRKPMPGFHPGVYMAFNNIAKASHDPFADYIKKMEPNGPWKYRLITPLSAQKQNKININLRRVALHLHVYYVDMLDDIIQRISINNLKPDLFISVKDEFSLHVVSEKVVNYPGQVVSIKKVPNRGRDIGSLLTCFGKYLVDNYDIIGHVHTKKSLDVVDRESIFYWNKFLLENMLGGKLSGSMIDDIISTMYLDNDIAIVFPDDPNVIGWTENRSIAENIAPSLGIANLPEEFDFPVGTMFWVRSSVLSRFVDLNLQWADYPPEPLPYDGTILHALERLFGIVRTSDCKQYAATYVSGVTR